MEAVARLRKEAVSGTWVDGKLGIWPFVERTVPQRTIKNRPVGNVELKPVTAVIRAEYVDISLDNVIPAISAKYSRRI